MRDEFKNKNWHNRGYLPHYEAKEKYQFITYRLSDSIPQPLLQKLKLKYSEKSDADNVNKRREIETLMDKGFGSGILKHPEAAKTVVDNWKYFDKDRYELCAYVVMPNHVHLLIKTNSELTVGELVKSWKSFTAKGIRKLFAERKNADYQSAHPGKDILQEGKPFWQREYWDRFIRDENHFNKAINYIQDNPVKAGLCENPKEWQWSSHSYL